MKLSDRGIFSHSQYSTSKPFQKAPAISFLDSPQPHQPRQQFNPQTPALQSLPAKTNQNKQSPIKEPKQQLRNVISLLKTKLYQ